MIVLTVFGGRVDSCPYKSDGNVGDPGFLTGWTVGFEVVSEMIIDVGFCGSFSFYCDYDKYRFF